MEPGLVPRPHGDEIKGSALPCSAILRAGERKNLLRHRAAAEMVGCRFAPEPPFPCLVRRSFNEGGTPHPFPKLFMFAFPFCVPQKEKAGQKFGKEQGYMVNAKSLSQK